MLRKFKKLQKTFKDLRGTSSKIAYQQLREDRDNFQFYFLDEFYIPAELDFLQKEHAHQFSYLKVDMKLREDRANGVKIPNLKNELNRRVEKYAEDKLSANIKLKKLLPIKQYLESMEKTIASQLR